MEIREHSFPLHLPLARDYIENFSKVAHLFDYEPYRDVSFHERYEQLQTQTFRCNRESLVNVLREYNQEIGNREQALHNIERLLNEKSVVVIGGQQPGILTGPLYTIHKIVTILSVAKREEKRLGVPVIPVFWIAGEDHDWDEVNHVFLQTSEKRVTKATLPIKVKKRASISHIPYDVTEVYPFIDQFLNLQPRTETTLIVREQLYQAAQQSHSYSHFFARLIVDLFGESGIVLIDSADSRLRAIEGDMFREIILHNDAISQLLQSTSEEVIHQGYNPQVESKLDNANLFFYESGERHAIEKDGIYRLRNRKEQFTQQELMDLAVSTPERFSCNVVTRPLMQEYLFPVLAFVGGPGEISYWALYRSIFHELGMKLPILIPRVTMSLVERNVQQIALTHQLSFDDLIHRLDECKEIWLNAQDKSYASEQFANVKKGIESLYEPLQKELVQIDPTLQSLSAKNLQIVLDQVAYLERKTRQMLEKRHEAVLLQFDYAKQSLLPNGQPQERIFNVFSFIIKFGYEWWETFKNLPFDVNGLHKEVRF